MDTRSDSLNPDSETPASSVWQVEQWLAYLGLAPFIYFALGFSLPGNVKDIKSFISYSAIILAFMAGTLWRRAPVDNATATNIFSNIIAIAAFLILLTPLLPSMLLAALSLLYVLLLSWERKNCRPDYPPWYWRLRLRLTALVVALHVYVYIRLLLI